MATSIPAAPPCSQPSSLAVHSCLGLAILLAALGTSSANVALPQLAQHYAVSFAQVQWVVLAYLLAITVFIVIVGRLSDWLGAKQVLLGGILLFALASLVAALAPAFNGLLLARALQGCGAATMMSLAMALVPQLVPANQASKLIGFLASMSAVGTAAGPAVGGLLLQWADWTWLFWLNLPLAGAALWLASRVLPAAQADSASQPANTAGFDVGGAVLLAITLLSYALAMTTSGYRGWLLAGAVLFLALFIRRQYQHQQAGTAALVPLVLIKQATLRQGFVLNFVVMSVMMATLVVGPFFLTQALGLQPWQVGLMMASGPLITAMLAWPVSVIVQRFVIRQVLLTTLLLMSLGALMLAILPASYASAGYLAGLWLLTLGYATFQSANNSAVMAQAAAGERGVVSGLLHLARNLGQLSGAALLGALFALASGSNMLQQASAAQLQHGMLQVFLFAAVLLLGTAGWLHRQQRPGCCAP